MRAVAIKRAAAGAILVLGLGAGVASAGAAKYHGEIVDDQPTAVTLVVDRAGGRATVVGFKVKELLIHCDGEVDARIGSAALDGEARVRDGGKFRLIGDEPAVKLAIRGRLIGKRAAEGTVVYSGMTTVDGEPLECVSGEQRWRARR